tara:strand:- start:95353 stop:96666 length:1314 start_codon:yes stop_codon:yes gene_type:complete
MKQILNKLLFTAFFLVVAGSNAQSLEDLIGTALEKNYQIRILKNEASMASNNNTAGFAGQLPTVDIEGGYTNSWDNTLQQFSDGTSREGNNARNTNLTLSALVNWTVFDGFRIYARKDQLGYLEELGQQNSKFFIEQTVSDVVSAYFQLVYERNLLDNYKKSLSISYFRYDLENKRKEIGVGTITDYGQALVDYQTDSIRYLAQQNIIQNLEVEINRAVNIDLETPLEPQETEFSNFVLPARDSLKNRMYQNNSQLEQQRLQELVAESELRIQRANRLPKIDIFAGYAFSRNTSEVGFFNSNQNYGPTIGVNVSYNLFNGGNTTIAIKNADLSYANSQMGRQQVDRDLNADVLKQYNEYMSITERITLAKSNVETSQKVYRAAEEQLKRGAINGYDFRLTQLTLLNSELALVQLQFSLKLIEINLNRISGETLSAYL